MQESDWIPAIAQLQNDIQTVEKELLILTTMQNAHRKDETIEDEKHQSNNVSSNSSSNKLMDFQRKISPLEKFYSKYAIMPQGQTRRNIVEQQVIPKFD